MMLVGAVTAFPIPISSRSRSRRTRPARRTCPFADVRRRHQRVADQPGPAVDPVAPAPSGCSTSSTFTAGLCACTSVASTTVPRRRIIPFSSSCAFTASKIRRIGPAGSGNGIRRPVGKAQTHEAATKGRCSAALRIAEACRCCRSIAFSITSGGYARRPSGRMQLPARPDPVPVDRRDPLEARVAPQIVAHDLVRECPRARLKMHGLLLECFDRSYENIVTSRAVVQRRERGLIRRIVEVGTSLKTIRLQTGDSRSRVGRRTSSSCRMARAPAIEASRRSLGYSVAPLFYVRGLVVEGGGVYVDLIEVKLSWVVDVFGTSKRRHPGSS